MKNLIDEAKGLQDLLVSYRRFLHENAEIGLDLPITTQYVIEKLTEMGYEPKEICKSGVLAIAGGKKPGKTILLRADMDALPIIEETGLPYKSKTGNAHGCGHDLHATMLLGAAKLLKLHEDEIEGTVKLMFQPGEEIVLGAKNMVDAGVLESPSVDAAMMIHVFTGMPEPAGVVILPEPGPFTASCDLFKITIQGKGGHGAMPNMTIDPLNIISHLHIGLQEINARELLPSDNAAITIGEMNGGEAANIIPDSAYMSGTIRTYDNNVREFVKKRIVEITNGIASSYRGSAKVEYINSCPSVINDTELANKFAIYTKEFIPSKQVVTAQNFANGLFKKLPGSEDFGFISEQVPSIFVALSACITDESNMYPQHHPKAQFSEEPLYVGASIYANTAIEWLKNNK
jgi:hippurate hydrolase